MLRKLILTETEKKQISSLHRLLNEEDGFATLQGYVKYKASKSPNSQVKLFQNEKLIKGATSDENGFFKIENIPLGKYTCKVTNKNEGYEEIVENIDLSQPKVYNQDFTFRDVQEFGDVTVTLTVPRTFIDVSVFDSDDKPFGPCKLEIFDSKGEPLKISKDVTDNNGVLNYIEILRENPNFNLKKETKECVEKVNISIKVTFGNLSSFGEYEICLNNGYISNVKNEDGEDGENKSVTNIVPMRYNKTNEEGVLIDTRDSNIFKINLKTKINYQIRVRDKETEESLKTATVKVFTDKEKTKVINQGNSPLLGSIKKERLEDGDFENQYVIYYEVSNEGYEPETGKIKVLSNKDNNNYVDLKKVVIKPPKPQKDITERQCIRLTRDFYNDMVLVNDGSKTIQDLGGNNPIIERRKDVESCFLTYKDKYPRRANEMVKRLVHVGSKLKIFGLSFTLEQNRDIYKENKTMSVSNTIRKIVSEQIEKKQIISEEKKLINKRYKFSLVGINKNRRRIVESTLREERIMLLRAGYNKTIVNETFLDVMNGLYGAEGNNVLKDVKTRLGQKIADQVKNKEDEHNMILTAFEELPEDVIERAIKENRVDELSAMIATKAMEGYKTSFGTEGISGLMFASVDENKFKQEVAKLIEPAIKDITTKMDEKFKQVQDAVSGIGLKPTA